mmetsp:Transcript_11497/g.23550  ORF Transcript_11497/g.23550 Transcript_11497/m.23550 type:complete len:271 (-) Transcript_11497:1180-1992(-)
MIRVAILYPLCPGVVNLAEGFLPRLGVLDIERVVVMAAVLDAVVENSKHVVLKLLWGAVAVAGDPIPDVPKADWNLNDAVVPREFILFVRPLKEIHRLVSFSRHGIVKRVVAEGLEEVFEGKASYNVFPLPITDVGVVLEFPPPLVHFKDQPSTLNDLRELVLEDAGEGDVLHGLRFASVVTLTVGKDQVAEAAEFLQTLYLSSQDHGCDGPKVHRPRYPFKVIVGPNPPKVARHRMPKPLGRIDDMTAVLDVQGEGLVYRLDGGAPVFH